MKINKFISLAVTCYCLSLLFSGVAVSSTTSYDISGHWTGKWKGKINGGSGTIECRIVQVGTNISGEVNITNTDYGSFQKEKFTGSINGKVVTFNMDTKKYSRSIIIDFTHGVISPILASDNMQIKDGIYNFYVDKGFYDKGTFSLDRTREKWVYSVESYGASSPAIGSDGKIYFTTESYLYALNPDGSEAWKSSFWPSWGGATTPALGVDGTIYVGADDDYLYSINPDGTLKWKIEGDFYMSAPAIGSDGTVYVSPSSLYAIDEAGSAKWKRSDIYADNAPSIGPDGTIYVATFKGDSDTGYNGVVYAINQDSTLKWEYNTYRYDLFTRAAIGPDGAIYLGSESNYLYALNPDGTLKWKYLTGADVVGPPAIGSDGTIYFGSEDNYLYALNTNGTLKWRYLTPDWVISCPAIGSNGTIYVTSTNGYLYALNSDGTLRWKFYSGGSSSPVISPDGTVYIGTADGLYALNSNSKGLANSSWPMCDHGPRHTANASDKYSISGSVKNSKGEKLNSIEITLSGNATMTNYTNLYGTYEFNQLGEGEYNVTPQSSMYTFSPTSRSVNISNASATGYDFIATLNSANPAVSVKSLKTTIPEKSTGTNMFRISRTGSVTKVLTVYYNISGTATNGVDYKYLSGKAVIAKGSKSVDLKVIMINDSNKEKKETIIIDLAGASTYSVGTPARAVVGIIDND